MMDGIARFVTQDGAEVFSLTDGATDAAVDWFDSLTPADIAARLGGRPLTVQFNAFLIRAGGHLTLVDTGYGPFADAAGGDLPARLAALGVTPDQIDVLFFTHLHTDHSGGALGPDGTPVYARARTILHRAEAAHWQSRDHHGARVLAACADRLTLAEDGAEIAPGLQLWHLPGHTPGHSGLRIGADCAIVGDVFHAARLQLPDPHLATKYDVEPGRATQTRIDLLTDAADGGLVLAGCHAVAPLQFMTVALAGAGFAGQAA